MTGPHELIYAVVKVFLSRTPDVTCIQLGALLDLVADNDWLDNYT